MAVTTAPGTEAMQAIVARINAGEAYALPIRADYTENIIDPLEEVGPLRVDVVVENEETLNETLAIEDRTSLAMRVWIRAKVRNVDCDAVDPLRLIVRQIFQQLNDFDSADGRVRVWECDYEPREIPDKTILNQMRMFVAALLLRVEVEPSA